MDQGRDPCPYRILDDVGGAFAMGCGGGTIWHAVRGWRNSPRGERVLGMTTAVKSKAPVLGGNFAVWGLLFSSFDCSFAALRRKEDPWNAISAGAATGGVLSARMGARSMAKNALVGGVLLALIEGFTIFIQQKMATSQAQMGPQFAEPAAPPPVTATLGGSGYLTTSNMADTSAGAFDIKSNYVDEQEFVRRQ